MNSAKCVAIAIVSAFVFSNVSFSAERQSFTSTQFLENSAEARSSYIAAAAMMAGVIAAQNKPSQARCVDEWMAQNRKDQFAAVTKVMRQYGEHHPQGIILAVLQKACGAFKYVD